LWTVLKKYDDISVPNLLSYVVVLPRIILVIPFESDVTEDCRIGCR